MFSLVVLARHAKGRQLAETSLRRHDTQTRKQREVFPEVESK